MFSVWRRREMRTRWPWAPSGVATFRVIFRQPRVWPPSRRCVLSDTCNNSVNGRKIELTLKADSSRSWELKALDESSGRWQLRVLVLLAETCVIRGKVRRRLQSSITRVGEGEWYVHHCLCHTSRAAVSLHAYYLCQSCQGHDEGNWEPSPSRHSGCVFGGGGAAERGVESASAATRSDLGGDSADPRGRRSPRRLMHIFRYQTSPFATFCDGFLPPKGAG